MTFHDIQPDLMFFHVSLAYHCAQNLVIGFVEFTCLLVFPHVRKMGTVLPILPDCAG